MNPLVSRLAPTSLLLVLGLVFPACGGGGGGAPADDQPLNPPAETLSLVGFDEDRTLSRSGDIPIAYRGTYPEGLVLRAFADADGELATDQDRFPLADDLPHPGAGLAHHNVDAAFFQEASFHVLLVAGAPADGIQAMSRGRITFGNTAFAQAIGDIDSDDSRALRLATLVDGRLVTAGSYGGAARLDTDDDPAWELPAPGGESATWLALHDHWGEPIWAHQLGGLSLPVDVVTQRDGSIYLSGVFLGALSFPDGRGGQLPIDSADQLMYFLASYDVDGHLRWVRMLETTNADDTLVEPLLAVRGRNEGVYVAGDVRGGMRFNVGEPDVTSIEPIGDQTAFIAAYDADGHVLLVNRDRGEDEVDVTSIAPTPDGGAVLGLRVQGQLRWQSDFAPNVTYVMDSALNAANRPTWDAGHLRLDRNLASPGGRLVASDGEEAARVGVAVHADGSVDLVTSLRPQTEWRMRPQLQNSPRLAGGSRGLVVIRYAADDVPRTALVLAADAEARETHVPHIVARPDGGAVVQVAVEGIYQWDGGGGIQSALGDILTFSVHADDRLGLLRLDGENDQMIAVDLAMLPDGGFYAAHAHFGPAVLYGRGDPQGTLIRQDRGLVLARYNADGRF